MIASIDVVILAWNDGDLVDRAVESALASTDVDVRVVVVDNGSDLPVTIDQPAVSVIRNSQNKGVAAGRNQGARAGRSEFLCFLDSDARLYPDTLSRLLEALYSDERVVLAAPVFDGQAPEASAGTAPTLARKLLRVSGRTSLYAVGPRRPEGSSSWDVDFAIGACQLVRRSAFEEVGGLDERYFYGPEDVDFCLRLIELGGRVIQVAEARCFHPPRRRNRRIATRRGVAHGRAVLRHLWRHRRFHRRHPIGQRGA